jgi:hypothetical protein
MGVRSLASRSRLVFPSRAAHRKTGVYELIVPHLPYKRYYRLEHEEVWILHIRDARRRPWEGEGDQWSNRPWVLCSDWAAA